MELCYRGRNLGFKARREVVQSTANKVAPMLASLRRRLKSAIAAA